MKCDVSIHLQAAERSAGEGVEGEVVVRVDEDVRANHVELEIGWFTHGKGNAVARTVEKARVPGGDWLAGSVRRFPFRFFIPAAGPVTSRGALINLDWQVKASVDLPWTIDPSATAVFVVGSGPRSEPLLEEPGDKTGEPPSADSKAWETVAASPFLITGATALGYGLDASSPLLVLIGLFFGGIPGIFVFRAWRDVLAHTAVGNVRLWVAPPRASPGEEVVFTLNLPRRAGPRVKEVSARLVGSECASVDSGSSHTFHTDVFCEVDVVVTERAGSAGPCFEGRLRVPARARPTLRVAHNSVTWHVKVDARVGGLPDPSWEREIVVLPEQRSA